MKYKLLRFSLLCILTMLCGGISPTWAAEKTSTLTFTAKCNGSGTADDGAAWTVTSDASESNFDKDKRLAYN